MNFFVRAALMGGFALLGACTAGPLVEEGEPTGYLRLVNNMGAPITVVLLSRCEASTHGLNRLNTPIASGKSFTFELGAGCWDIRADTDITGDYTYQRARIKIEAGGMLNLTSG